MHLLTNNSQFCYIPLNHPILYSEEQAAEWNPVREGLYYADCFCVKSFFSLTTL